MKTEVIMKREFFGDFIQQRSHSELFCATDLLRVENEKRKLQGKNPKFMQSYFDTQETKELINQIKWEFSIQDSQVKSVTKGRHGGTWMHPMLFVDFAMWLSVETKVRVLKWVLDGLMELRDNSGDSFKYMNAALLENYPNHANATNYMRIANAISKACGVYELGSDKWQLATKEQIEMRDRIQGRIVTYADVVDNMEDCINRAIQKELNVKI
jgi:hypothetical protein